MNIGYDSKRAFQNKTGLGNYSRSLITILSRYFPQHHYILFAPRQTSLFKIELFYKVRAIEPQNPFFKKFPSLWRRMGMVKEIKTAGLDIYHGLSNELPRGIQKANIKTIVTIHDLIFERFPETYHFDERYVHRWKIKHACKIADAIIAISQQTKDDLINLYKVKAEKIFICYQSCNPIFEKKSSEEEKAIVKKRYRLPGKYFLFVSSIAPRKNLLTVCRAMILLKDQINIPLLVIGDGKKEKENVRKLMQSNGMEERLILLNEMQQSKEDSFASAEDFPAIYQQATALIYPSVFEGFGLPLLEAFWSGLPVICSNASSLPEVAAAAALYFSPTDHEMLAKHMLNIFTDNQLVSDLKNKGFERAQSFASDKYADSIMKVYNHVNNR
ncbi:MAG: glycosyl transferase, group 1 family protein [Ferruginibacter sp.]|nr:glycosyl transferase, group 1 family protein [Ferruginibacter sp.]